MPTISMFYGILINIFFDDHALLIFMPSMGSTN